MLTPAAFGSRLDPLHLRHADRRTPRHRRTSLADARRSASSFRSAPAPASTSPRGVLADKLSAKWGQPVVVENKPGGDAIIAITAVIGAHDDHVLLFAPASTFTAHPLLHDKLPYNIKDLVPIARVTNTLIVLGVPTELWNVGSVKELVAKIKAAPGKLNYASVTGANDLMFEAFLKTEKLQMAKVPYKDPVTAINDLSEGRIHAFVGAYAIMRPRVLAGKVKVIALDQSRACGGAHGYSDRQGSGLQIAGIRWPGRPDGAARHAVRVREHIAADIRAAIAADRRSCRELSATGQVVNPGTPAEFAARARRSTRHRDGDRQDAGDQGGAVIHAFSGRMI